MAAERLQFHEMGLDDRLLKVANRLTFSVNPKQTVGETKKPQLKSKNRREVKKTRHKYRSY